MIPRTLYSLLLAIALTACAAASTDITSFVDPSYRGEQRFSSVAVFALGVGLEERQNMENTLAASFTNNQVRAVRGIDLVPPTRQITDDELASTILESGVETVLVVSAGGKDFSQTYVPQTYYPGTTHGTAQTFGNMTYFNLQQSPGYTIGGYNISKPRAMYGAILIDVHSGQTIWTADASSRGNAFAKFADLGNSAAEETVQQLMSDGLF